MGTWRAFALYITWAWQWIRCSDPPLRAKSLQGFVKNAKIILGAENVLSVSICAIEENSVCWSEMKMESTRRIFGLLEEIKRLDEVARITFRPKPCTSLKHISRSSCLLKRGLCKLSIRFALFQESVFCNDETIKVWPLRENACCPGCRFSVLNYNGWTTRVVRQNADRNNHCN